MRTITELKSGPRPTHPGQILRKHILPARRLAVIEAAHWLGVTRQALHAIMRGENPARISADMAVRLAQAFDTTPEMWVRMQAAWDVWQALQSQKGQTISRYPVKADLHKSNDLAGEHYMRKKVVRKSAKIVAAGKIRSTSRH